jgi:RNA-binding protein
MQGKSMKRIYVGNLSFGTEEEGLKGAFQKFGEVGSVSIIVDRDTGRSKGFAFVEMPDDENAMEAIKNLNGSVLDGRKIRVDIAEERRPNPNSSRR